MVFDPYSPVRFLFVRILIMGRFAVFTVCYCKSIVILREGDVCILGTSIYYMTVISGVHFGAPVFRVAGGGGGGGG